MKPAKQKRLPLAQVDRIAREAEREQNERINEAILKAGCPVQTRWSRKKGWH